MSDSSDHENVNHPVAPEMEMDQGAAAAAAAATAAPSDTAAPKGKKFTVTDVFGDDEDSDLSSDEEARESFYFRIAFRKKRVEETNTPTYTPLLPTRQPYAAALQVLKIRVVIPRVMTTTTQWTVIGQKRVKNEPVQQTMTSKEQINWMQQRPVKPPPRLPRDANEKPRRREAKEGGRKSPSRRFDKPGSIRMENKSRWNKKKKKRSTNPRQENEHWMPGLMRLARRPRDGQRSGRMKVMTSCRINRSRISRGK